MNILDLNHIEAVEGNEVVGGSYYYGNNIDFSSDVYKTQYVNRDIFVKIKKDFKTDLDLDGWVAEAEAVSNASGPKTFSNSFTGTQTFPGGSSSLSESDAATQW